MVLLELSLALTMQVLERKLATSVVLLDVA